MLSFDSFTTAALVNIRIPVAAETFGSIGLITAELNQIESQRKSSELPTPKFDFPKRRGYRLVSFEVRSPPEVSVLADPSWLAVYIGLLALGVSCLQLLGSYSSVKRGARELMRDLGELRQSAQREIQSVVDAFRGFTDAQKADLIIGATLFVEDIERGVEDLERRLLRATRFASILTRRAALPTLEARVERRERNGG